MTRRITVVIVATLGLSACQYDPYTSRYATTRPDPSNLIGVWMATPETVKDLSVGPTAGLAPRIEIGADGTIRMTDVPDAWRKATLDGARTSHPFKGRWELSRHQQRWWSLSLSDAGWVCSGCLMVLGKRPPYLLVLRYGDPDSGSGYEFERLPE